MGVEAGGAGERGDALAYEKHGERAADDACNGGGREHDRDGKDAVAHPAVAGPPAGGAAKVTYKRAGVSTCSGSTGPARARACMSRAAAGRGVWMPVATDGRPRRGIHRRGGNAVTRGTSQYTCTGKCMSDYTVTGKQAQHCRLLL